MLDQLRDRSVVMHLDGDSYHLRSHDARTDKLLRPSRPAWSVQPEPVSGVCCVQGGLQ
jgi:hypothetical protein